MSQPAHSEGAAQDDEPMEIDAGKRSLEQSRHHPRYQKASHNMPNMPAEGPPNEQRESSDIQTQIRGIITSLGIQDPTGRLPEVFLNFVVAIRNDTVAS